jgi:hypothetical protein
MLQLGYNNKYQILRHVVSQPVGCGGLELSAFSNPEMVHSNLGQSVTYSYLEYIGVNAGLALLLPENAKLISARQCQIHS